MLKIKELQNILEKICPLSLSEAFKNNGHYDNSGTLIEVHKNINKIFFCLDISKASIEKAIEMKADTIITHHPAIYYPISSLSIDNSSVNIINAIKNDINIISMHLNLDIASGGIDDSLAFGLGGKKLEVIEKMTDNLGYGKEFTVDKIDFSSFVEKIKNEFSAERVFVYGEKNKIITKVASFCGGGGDSSIKYAGDADVIVTSDMPHHIIKELLERGKNIVILTHYISENYGFKRFYNTLSNILQNKAECCYFDDTRFN